jgi:hypothetical protein
MCSFLTFGGVIPLQEQVSNACDLKVEITHKLMKLAIKKLTLKLVPGSF